MASIYQYADSLRSAAYKRAKESGGKLRFTKVGDTIRFQYIAPNWVPLVASPPPSTKTPPWRFPDIKRIPDSRVDEIVEMRESGGMSNEDVAKELGITRERVRQILAKAGLAFYIRTTPTPEERQAAAEQRRELEKAIWEKRLKMRKYGSLRITEILPGYAASGHIRVIVECDCGVVKNAELHNIRYGRTLTCGMRFHYKRGWLPSNPPRQVVSVPKKYEKMSPDALLAAGDRSNV